MEVQDHMTQFIAQMTQLFASLVTTQHQPSGSIPKHLIHILKDGDENIDKHEWGDEILKGVSEHLDRKRLRTSNFICQVARRTHNGIHLMQN
jgi:hypothetical protein